MEHGQAEHACPVVYMKGDTETVATVEQDYETYQRLKGKEGQYILFFRTERPDWPVWIAFGLDAQRALTHLKGKDSVRTGMIDAERGARASWLTVSEAGMNNAITTMLAAGAQVALAQRLDGEEAG